MKFKMTPKSHTVKNISSLIKIEGLLSGNQMGLLKENIIIESMRLRRRVWSLQCIVLNTSLYVEVNTVNHCRRIHDAAILCGGHQKFKDFLIFPIKLLYNVSLYYIEFLLQLYHYGTISKRGTFYLIGRF